LRATGRLHRSEFRLQAAKAKFEPRYLGCHDRNRFDGQVDGKI